VHSHEELSRQAADGTASARRPRLAEGRDAYLLDLQRASGNAAVARLVQRAPREHAASTDIADVIDKPGSAASHGAPAKPAAPALKPNPEVEKFRVLASHVDGFDDAVSFGNAALKDTGPVIVNYAKAAAFFERAYHLNPHSDMPSRLVFIYQKLHDSEHADYWRRGGPGAAS
jgi:hypothetical protein